MRLRPRIKAIREGMIVRRYHQYYTHERDTVGKHSCGVALMANLINPSCRKEVLMAALTHDLGEAVIGDIPSPMKKRLSPAAKREVDYIENQVLIDNGMAFCDLLTDTESLLLKLCDCLDGLLFCTEELARGNKSLIIVGNTYAEYLVNQLNLCEDAPWYETARNVLTVVHDDWISTLKGA